MKKKIAWIEDDIDIIYPVVQPLTTAGFEILEFRNYSEAVASLQQIAAVSLILLDLILPQGNDNIESQSENHLGLDLLRMFRQKGIKVPVVVLSVISELSQIDQEELKQLNAIAVSKPIRPTALKSIVYQCLGLDVS